MTDEQRLRWYLDQLHTLLTLIDRAGHPSEGAAVALARHLVEWEAAGENVESARYRLRRYPSWLAAKLLQENTS